MRVISKFRHNFGLIKIIKRLQFETYNFIRFSLNLYRKALWLIKADNYENRFLP